MRKGGEVCLFDFEKGHGFIKLPGEEEHRLIFVNYTDFVGSHANIVELHDKVLFTLVYSSDGEPTAKLVEVVDGKRTEA